MYQFKTASRNPEEMKLAQSKVVEAFDMIKNQDGSIRKSGVRELKNLEMEIGELIIQLMNDQVEITDPTPFFVDPVEGDIRNDYVWQEVSAALRVVDRAYGSKPKSQRLTFTEFSMVTQPKEIAVEVPLEQIASGRYNPGLISEVLAEAVNRWRVGNILDSLDTAVTAVADRTGKAGYVLRYTGLTDANLDKAIDGLQDEGNSPTIFARHVALVGIRAFTGWASTGSDAALREFEMRGMVGSYHGAPIVSLRDRFSRRVNNHLIRNDRIYMASGTKGAIYMKKDMSFLNFSEVLPAESVYRVGIRLEEGLKVWDPYQYRIITVP